jgi:hypothetical protein
LRFCTNKASVFLNATKSKFFRLDGIIYSPRGKGLAASPKGLDSSKTIWHFMLKSKGKSKLAFQESN